MIVVSEWKNGMEKEAGGKKGSNIGMNVEQVTIFDLFAEFRIEGFLPRNFSF